VALCVMEKETLEEPLQESLEETVGHGDAERERVFEAQEVVEGERRPVRVSELL